MEMPRVTRGFKPRDPASERPTDGARARCSDGSYRHVVVSEWKVCVQRMKCSNAWCVWCVERVPRAAKGRQHVAHASEKRVCVRPGWICVKRGRWEKSSAILWRACA